MNNIQVIDARGLVNLASLESYMNTATPQYQLNNLAWLDENGQVHTVHGLRGGARDGGMPPMVGSARPPTLNLQNLQVDLQGLQSAEVPL